MKRIINYSIMATMIFSVFSCACTSTSRRDFKENLNDRGDVYKILYYASLAGNSHNTQPWKVKVIDDYTIEVYADTLRHLRVVDPTRRGLFISLGAFIENINLAAGSLGYYADIVIKAEKPTDTLAAIIKLSKTEKTNFNLEDLENRKTTRTPFESKPIAEKDLKQIAENFQNLVFIPANSDNGKYISTKTLEAYTQQANDENAKNELAAWIRFSNADVKANRDGLTTGGMGINGFGGFMVRNFFKPADSKKQSFVDKGVDKTKAQVDNCAGWILISQTEDTPENWINTGRIYERINITCSRLGIGFHPMNQMIEEANFESEANANLSIDGRIQFVARIGYTEKQINAVSVRRSVTEFATFE
jgi:nitroreductase